MLGEKRLVAMGKGFEWKYISEKRIVFRTFEKKEMHGEKHRFKLLGIKLAIG